MLDIEDETGPQVPAAEAAPRPESPAGARRLIATYLASLEDGLLLVERDGRVAVCNSRMLALLGMAHRRDVVGSAARHLLRHAYVGLAEDRSAILDRLREPLKDRRPVQFGVNIDQTRLLVTFRPLPDAGWAVSVAETAEASHGREPDGWHDGLTGLANRAFYNMRLTEAVARLQRTGEGFALMVVDLDRFKQVNDSLGHPIGDELLRKVAERLKSAVRPIDTVARLGGDEFAIMQSNVADPWHAETLARRIVDLVGRSYIVDGHLINVGASVGIAVAPDDGTKAETLFKFADLALYDVKVGGRGTFRFFKPEFEARMDARRQLELDLRKALAMHEFELVYQPQMNLRTNRLVGCEALIRWRHPVRGLVSPTEFIPLAEEIGLIVPIGEWVIRTACEEAARWPGDLSVAVNLSPMQFKSKKLIERVKAALDGSGLAPNRLELEITEGVLLQENEANLATLHALRALGARISMDDFGTGYSSLSYLRSFPFDKIKIDKSFISDGPSNKDSLAIIRAIASLGASFGMTTVAEGVETPDQMRNIRDEGCTDVQGYLISRPVAAKDVRSLLADQTWTSSSEV